MRKHIPNVITLLRLVAAPFILWLYFRNQIEAAILTTLVASFTDFFDGWAARRLNQVSRTGAILDPVADKVLILTLFGMLYVHAVIPWWLFVISTVRNISQLLSIPVLLGWKKISFHVKPRLIPKWGSALSYVIILLGLMAMSSTLSEHRSSLAILIFATSVVLSVLEVQILVTYWPRFLAIYHGRHDTFE